MPIGDPDTQPIEQNSLPVAYRTIPVAVAKWIDNAVPCIAKGPQSQKVTDAVLRRLRREGVSDQVISDAFDLSAYKFGMAFLNITRAPIYVPNDHPAPVMSARDPGDDFASMKQTAQIYEQRYRAAMASHNLAMLRAIARALFDLFVGSGTPNEDSRKEKERLELLREEIEANAPTVTRSFRRSSGPPPGGRNRIRQIGPHEYEILDDDVIEEDAAEGEGEGEGEAD